jgi:putative ABC transport system permease protein
MVRLFNADFEIAWLPNTLSVLATAAIAVATGWLASLRILSQKLLEILRQE